MTWIVGVPTVFGYSFAVSDVRVTLADGSERDCLQKIHPIANSIALGFAGSVYIGFAMVEAMKNWLKCDIPTAAWLPLETVDLWPEVAREVFASCPPEERDGRCHLLMLSTDPKATNGPGPQAYAHIFRSPNFEPETIGTTKVVGIGSGSFIEDYKRNLEGLSSDHQQRFSLMQMEAGNPGGMGTNLGFLMTRWIMERNPSGISSHLHYCWVYLGKTIIKTNDHMTAGAWTGIMDSGSGINRPETQPTKTNADHAQTNPNFTLFSMPKGIAQTWNELERMLQSSGARAEGAVA
jgi:hypothetical protein